MSEATREIDEPLEMLLHLVEQGKLEVTTISIAPITSAYIAEVRSLTDRSPEELTEFIVLGSRLLYIKSLALLPKGQEPDQVAEISRLNFEIEEYRRIRAASKELSKLQFHPTWSRPAGGRHDLVDLPDPRVTASSLQLAFISALSKIQPTQKPSAEKTSLSVKTATQNLLGKLSSGGFDIESVFSSLSSRLEIIVTFLALLELMREGKARVAQTSQFGGIQVEPAGVC